MKAVTLLATAAVVCCWMQASEGANILALFPLGGKSHWIVFREMLVQLGKRGHHLTVVTPFQEQHDNWEVLKLPDPDFDARGFSFLDYGKLPGIAQILLMFRMSVGQCREHLENKGVQGLLNSEDRKYDLVIIETFFHDCLLAFAHKFKTPIVGACALGGGSSWINDLVGNPYPLSYLPETVVPYTSKMNLFQRTYNVFASLCYNFYRQYIYLPGMDKVVQEYFKDPTMPSLSQLEHNTSLLLLNSHFSFHFPRPLVPNAVEVAGMHIKPPKKLPQDMQQFMDTAKDGVIYFSMGSNIESSDLPVEIRNVFIKVFSKLKEKVIWKFETDAIDNIPTNMKIGKWFPQSDLLAHKNIKFFMTHGGMMSLQEALYHGIPLLGIPVYGDQEPNLLKAQENGFAIMLKFDNITEESLRWAVNELLTNPSYMASAKKYSKLFHDRPEKPLDTAINSIEYVLRHKGAYHMRSAALDLAWYQYYLLDVLLFLLLCAASVLVAVVLIAKAIMRIVFKSSDSALKKKKKSTKKD